MIKLDNVCFGYDKNRIFIKNLDLYIKKGEFVALTGHNGAGKTTLLKLLNGILKPLSGTVFINGKNTRNEKVSSLAREIVYLFQNPDHQILCKTVYDEIAFGLRNTGTDEKSIQIKVNKFAQKTGILNFLQKEPFSLSKGLRQRVALASVLAMESDILVLDEPTTGQDLKESAEIMNIIKELNDSGKTILMVTHDLELASRFCQRIIVLANGSIVKDGNVSKVLYDKSIYENTGLQPPQLVRLIMSYGDKELFGYLNEEEIADYFIENCTKAVAK